MGSSKSFSKRITSNVLLTVSILLIVILLIVSICSHLLMAKEATKSVESSLEAATKDIELTLQSAEITTMVLSRVAEYGIEDAASLSKLVYSTVQENPIVVGSTIAFCQSEERGEAKAFYAYSLNDSVQVKPIKGSELAEKAWYQLTLRQRAACWSEPFFDNWGCNHWVAAYCIPLTKASGEVYAVVTTEVPLDWIANKVNSIHPYMHSHTTIASHDGAIMNMKLDTSEEEETLLSFADQQGDATAQQVARRMMNGESGVDNVGGINNRQFVVYGPLNNGWSAAIVCGYREVLQNSIRLHQLVLLLAVIGILVLYFVCTHTIKKLTHPLTELSEAALSMAKGNFSAQLPEIKTEDEMMRLRDSFAYMQKSITEYIAELKTTTLANERMESELNVARNIQLGMLPKDFPVLDCCQLYAKMEPAKQVGGDLYDFRIKDNMLYFVVGDVSGKGVPAALVMAITRAAFRFFIGLGMPMNEVVGRINRSIAERNDHCMFVTLFAGRIDLKTGEMRYCNAGHNPIVVAPATGDAYYLKSKTNLAVGLLFDFEYEEESMMLQPGTRLMLYTDGVIEAETVDKQQFGEDRLLQLASDLAGNQCSAQEATCKVFDAVKDFVQGNDQNDDITLLLLEISKLGKLNF